MKEEIVKKLESKKTKPTSMRILIYDFIAQQKNALSLSEIENHVPHSDRITIYRTLKTFEEKGIIHSIQENNTTKYILCNEDCNEETHKDYHLHLYCKLCKQTTCEENSLILNDFNTSFRIDEVRFFAKGICQHCLE
jgi:Fur family ferric uptake transcriptional regulator